MGAPDALKPNGRPIILFDGVCNLCNGAVQFILKRDHSGKFLFASLQSAFAAEQLIKFKTDASSLYSIIVIKNGRLYDRSNALLEIARDLKGVWSLFYAFKIIPEVLRDSLYKVVANNRYKFFGKEESCMMPSPELQSRFLN